MCLDAATLSRISQHIRAAYHSLWLFKADWALIATWHNVTFYGVTATRPPVSNTSVSWSELCVGCRIVRMTKTNSKVCANNVIKN